jgi:hypothetical protein
MILIFHAQYKLLSSSLCTFIQLPVVSPTIGPNILLSSMFSNTIYDLNVRPRDKTAGQITVVCILIFTFLDKRHEDKGF